MAYILLNFNMIQKNVLKKWTRYCIFLTERGIAAKNFMCTAQFTIFTDSSIVFCLHTFLCKVKEGVDDDKDEIWLFRPELVKIE